MSTIIGPDGPAFEETCPPDCARPFGCGSAYDDWRVRNCDRCNHGYRDGMSHQDVPCAIDRALAEGALGYGWVHHTFIDRAGIGTASQCREFKAAEAGEKTND